MKALSLSDTTTGIPVGGRTTLGGRTITSVLSLSFYKMFGLYENKNDDANNDGWSDTELWWLRTTKVTRTTRATRTTKSTVANELLKTTRSDTSSERGRVRYRAGEI